VGNLKSRAAQSSRAILRRRRHREKHHRVAQRRFAHVAGKDWLGSLPERGPIIYIGAEDDKDELHIRLAAIAKHCDVSFAQLVQDGLHVLPLLGQDATLCTVGKRGRVEKTSLYKQIYEAAGDIKPKNISIDTLDARLRRQ
jgi:RecA-family ATPase